MATWKKVIVSGSIAELNTVSASIFDVIGSSQVIATPATTVLSGSFSGSFLGEITTTLANAPQSNFVAYNVSTGKLSYSGTGSFTSATASYITSSGVYGPFGANSILSASYAVTSSNAITAQTASYVVTAQTASYVLQAVSASFATSAATATTASYVLQAVSASFATSAVTATTASYVLQAVSASFASTAAQLNNALTLGTGLIGTSYNGSTAVTTAISGAAALTTNLIPKWTGTGFANSNITDTGTQVQIGAGASSGVTVAAGGISVTGNSTFNNNLTVTGDLTVNGTASFVNSTNLYVRDQFITINSGSSTLTDSGIISQYNVSGSGSAFFLEAASAGTYGRWAVAYDLIGTSTAAVADEFMVTAKINQAGNPSNATPPTWGSSGNGSGNMWVTNAGDIYIYA